MTHRVCVRQQAQRRVDGARTEWPPRPTGASAGRCALYCNSGYVYYQGTCEPFVDDDFDGCRAGYDPDPDPLDPLSAGGWRVRNLHSSTQNCGSVGNVCERPDSAAAIFCNGGQCLTLRCDTGYRLVENGCVENLPVSVAAARQRARPRRRALFADQVCPLYVAPPSER